MKGKISLNNFIQENMNRNIIYSLTGMLIFVLTACTDDWLNNEGERMPEGEVSVSATVEFLPLRPALDVNTRTAGDVIKDINDLCVLLYDEEGNLVKSYYLLPKGAASTVNSMLMILTVQTQMRKETKRRKPKPSGLPSS